MARQLAMFCCPLVVLRKAWISAIIFLNTCLIAASPASAEQVGIKVCLLDIPPWGSSALPDHGILVDVLNELSGITGVRFEYHVLPFKRALDFVKNGYCQFTVSIDDVARPYDLIRGATVIKLDFGVMPRRGLELTNVNDLKGHKIARVRGLTIGTSFDSDPQIVKIDAYGAEETITMTEHGRADGALGSIPTMSWWVRQHHTADLFDRPFVLVKDMGLYLEMNSDFATSDTARQIGGAMEEMESSGKAQELVKRLLLDW